MLLGDGDGLPVSLPSSLIGESFDIVESEYLEYDNDEIVGGKSAFIQVYIEDAAASFQFGSVVDFDVDSDVGIKAESPFDLEGETSDLVIVTESGEHLAHLFARRREYFFEHVRNDAEIGDCFVTLVLTNGRVVSA